MDEKTNQYRKFIRYECLVDELSEAWVFVMSHLDEFQTPGIEITGQLGNWDGFNDDDEPTVKYKVVVFGDTEGGW